jgi:Replication-relaxation
MDVPKQTPNGWRLLSPSEPDGSLVITERDLDLFAFLILNRVANTNQLAAIFGEKIRRRLLKLARHGYVMRPAAQRVWRAREGGDSHALCYAISNRGARVHASRRGVGRGAPTDWNERNRRLSPAAQTIPHQLGVGDVRVAFARAAAARGLALREGPALFGQRWRGLRVPGRRAAMRPDWVATVAQSEQPTNLFFLEYDRVSEDDARLEEKCRSYLLYAKSWRMVSDFGVRGFRVLIVTTGGEQKVRNLVRLIARVCGAHGHRRFLVIMADELSGADPFAISWLDALGRETYLTQ